MSELSNRDLVISALLRGKEQRINYLVKALDDEELFIRGKVAVIGRKGSFLVLIQQVKGSPAYGQATEYHADELHTLPDLAAVEHLLATRLRTRLDELRPSKGMRLFSQERLT